ncbi:MAG: EamA family transporter [Candidatus Woesearchaeota archaeon]|jgi:drug/metabolite transporter (DMT)-like permease
MILAWVLALISPLFYAGVNVYDKYIVERVAKHHLSYMVVEGGCFLSLAIMVGVFLDWSSFSFSSIIFPVITGLIYGGNTWWYYYLISKEDVSNVIGMMYIYPLFVSLMSFILLKEVIPFLGYVGMILTIIGAVWISTRIERFNFKILGVLVLFILGVALGEFMIKIVTNNLPPLNGWVIGLIVSSLVTVIGIFFLSIRKNVKKDVVLFPIAMGGALITCVASLALYFAIDYLPVTIVSAVGATQPLFVVLTERIVNLKLGIISKDLRLVHKLGAVILVVVGVILIYASALL